VETTTFRHARPTLARAHCFGVSVPFPDADFRSFDA
jgi:hypothetical protein